MSSLLRSLTISSALVGLAALSSAPVAAGGLRHANTQSQAQDLGPSDASDVVTATLVLKVNSLDALETVVALSQQPGLPTFHRFISTNEFADLFAPSKRDIKKITDYLTGFGINVDEVYSDRLLIRATGTTDAFNQAFSVQIHTKVAKDGRRFHCPSHAPKVPLFLKDLLVAVEGLDQEGGALKPAHHNVLDSAASLLAPKGVDWSKPGASLLTGKPGPNGAIATGQPGEYTVGDVANFYNINPLYDDGIDGTGRTIGIATLANFIPDDAYTYWAEIGLDVDQTRITQVHVDGGGELSKIAGSGETSLDVEQSGGLAPGAKIIVYDAPNTSDGFLDLFYRAVSDNQVDTLSLSWGEAEEFYYEPVGGEDDVAQFKALHQVFLEGAIQGISLFASSGDNGAYQIDKGFNTPVNNVLTVNAPAADPALIAAGGTTTPLTLSAGPGTPDLVVATEQVWGWDYIQNYLVEFVDPSFQNELFPSGGGGGVSIYWPRPYYQDFLPGIQKTQPNQSVIFDPGDGTGPQDLMDLPANFKGRNLPDISLDGDPESGFLFESTEDGGLVSGEGGTSFVAPQLNGITTLLVQATHGRLGQLNPSLYRYRAEYGYSAKSPLVDITAGDNWFYSGVAGYDDGAGLGVLNVQNWLTAVKRDNRFRF